jgi:acetate kinase
MSIVVVNAGSSSIKFGLFDFETLASQVRGLLEWGDGDTEATLTLTPADGEATCHQIVASDHQEGVAAALRHLVSDHAAVRAVGHRLIHGGEELRRPVLIDDAVKKVISRYSDLAPLHIPAGLEAIAATEAALPGVPQVGLFDTGFFGDLPPAEYIYPVPYEWYQSWGIRRFGFHGISHAYCAARAEEMLAGYASSSRLILCHLGQGCSVTAVRDGVARTNSLGYTSLDGLPMGTRCGSIDPGILLHVQRQHGLSLEDVSQALNKQSGLFGISGVSADLRKIEQAAALGNERAQLAIDVFVHRVRATIGSAAVTLGGVDALVFAGGIGENSPALRQAICRGLQCLGLALDPHANLNQGPDFDVATPDSQPRILLIHAREDLMIAKETRRLLNKGVRTL